MNLNKAIIAGNLTRDPETRSLPSGQSVVSFSIATNRFWTDQSGNKQESTEFHNIVAFGKLAEICSRYLSKGRLVLIEGRIQTRSWQDQQSGNKRYRTEIIAENMQMGPRYDSSQNTSPNPSAATPQQPTSPAQDDIPVIDAETPPTETETSAENTLASAKEDNENVVDVKNIPF